MHERDLALKQQHELQAASASASEAEKKLAAAQKECERLTKEIHAREQQFAGQIEKLRIKAADAVAREEQTRALTETNTALGQQLESAKAELQRMMHERDLALKQQHELQAASASASEAEKKLTAAQQECERLTKEIHAREQQFAGQIEKLRVQAADAVAHEDKTRALTETNKALGQQLESAKAELQRMTHERDLALKQQHELQAASASASEAEKKLTAAQQECERLTKEIHAREQEAAKRVGELQSAAERSTGEAKNLKQELAASAEKCATLERRTRAITEELDGSKAVIERSRKEQERETAKRGKAESADRQAVSSAEQRLAEAQRQCEALRHEVEGKEKTAAKKLHELQAQADKAVHRAESLEKDKLELTKRLAELENENEQYAQIAATIPSRAGITTLPARRRPKPFARVLKMAAGIIIIAGLSFGSYMLGIRSYESRESQLENQMAETELPPVETLEPTVKSREPIKSAQKEPEKLEIAPIVLSKVRQESPPQPKVVPWPSVKVDNVRIVQEQKTCAIVFEFGVFRSLTKLSDGALGTLEQVASQLRGSISDFDLVVEGHTDMVPISSGAASNFADNSKLGEQRAKVVRDLFRDKFNIPGERMTVVSEGENNPPFSNDDDVSRRKNRTVVLKLTRRAP